MRTNRMSLKIISYILIQAFICLDLFAAGAIANPVDVSTLAPELVLGQADFKVLIEKINKEEEMLDLEKDMRLEDESDPLPDEGGHDITNVDTSGRGVPLVGDSTSTLNAKEAPSVAEGNQSNNSVPPPDELSDYVLSISENGIFAKFQIDDEDDGSDAIHEITYREYMQKTGLTAEEMAFVELTVKPIVLKNSAFFQNAQLCSPTNNSLEDEIPEAENELQRQARGPFRVKANTTLQNLIELGLSAVTLGQETKDVVALMYNALVNLTDDSIAEQKKLIRGRENEVIKVLYTMAKQIENTRAMKLADVYKLATVLVGKFKGIGIEFSDIARERRKTISVRPQHVPKLLEKYNNNPARMKLYLKYMMLFHEEGHTSLVAALAHQLKTVFSLRMAEILDVFRVLINKDWPNHFISKDFHPLPDDENRSQIDLITLSLWLLKQHPQRKNLFGVYWPEAMAHYYAYLKIKKMHKDDLVAIEALSLGIHYSLELNPPELENLRYVLQNSVNSFYPFLTAEEGKEVIKRVIELQIEEDGVFVEKARIELEQIKEGIPSNLLGKFMNAFGAIILCSLLWVKTGHASNDEVFFNSVMTYGVSVGVIIAVGFGLNWLWKKLWGKTTEQRTVELVNQVAIQYKKYVQNVDLGKLQEFYTNASFSEREVIINTIRNQIISRANNNEIDSSIFEPFFKNILKFGPKDIFNTLQNIVTEKKKLEISGIAEKLDALNEGYAEIESKISKLGLEGIDSDKVTTAFLQNVVVAGLFWENSDYNKLVAEPECQKFFKAIETKTMELKLLAASALNDFSELGMGTGRLVLFLKRYLRAEGTNISLPLERKITSVIEKLTKESVSRVRIKAEMPLSTTAGADNKPAVAIIVSTIKISRQSGKSMFTNKDMVESAI